ncbi:ThuA domain-containing protein [Dyadobacter sp. CY345]|uniref:ThuA domain-containing protein n=1 Tax=Dyadobacter sp. CY345 TaxID=2909335 RepID=UPI001F3688F2|nr:ThuA domain-containing protein [Dyadobacter sp. CY345]MCF2446713.1 ThuA domain-containing protein [Dyadobacter sp. CY345]
MTKNIKIFLRTIIALVVIAAAAGALVVYKIKNGFPVSFETDQPEISFPANKPALLLFSKTTGYRHSESIEAAKHVFQNLSEKNNWFLYETEEGGVFNPEQLRNFKVIIINNATGRILSAEQQKAVKQFVDSGGTLIGIHGTGDFSHDDWPWMNTNLVGARFSHHPLNPQLQAAQVHIDKNADSIITHHLPESWKQTDEWYIYFSQPKGVKIVAFIDGEKILPSGNMFFVHDKNFGMGKYQPVAWYRNVGSGKTFYTSMGHDPAVWKNENFVSLLENAVYWSIK